MIRRNGYYSSGSDAPMWLTQEAARVWFNKGILKAHVTRIARRGTESERKQYEQAEIVQFQLSVHSVEPLKDKVESEAVLYGL